jgi:hypothetical protein
MARERDRAIEWFDRGRERWRARPEKKQRSYEEHVYQRPPSWPREGGAKTKARGALRTFVTQRDEDRLDRALADCRGRGFRRWSRATLRREHVASQPERKANAMMRQVESGQRFWPPNECLRCDEHERESDWQRRFELREALVRATLEHFRAVQGPLFEHRTFVERIAKRGQRKLVARRLSRWIGARRRPPAHLRVRDTLRSVAALPVERAQGRPLFQWIAMRFAGLFGWLPRGYARGAYDERRWVRERHAEHVDRALSGDPALREALEAWVRAVLPDAYEADRLARATWPRFRRW